MAGKLVLTKDEVNSFMKNASMNHQYGMQAYMLLDKEKAQALLPPPLKVTDPALGYLYIVNIREPTFSPWYMEGGVGIMAECEGVTGLYFLGLQLSGPGALMGMCSGRESSGLPKKLCDRIRVERLENEGHCFIERDGVRLVDLSMTMGEYNDPFMTQMNFAQEKCSPDNPIVTGGGCLLHRYTMGGKDKATDLRISYYDSPSRFTVWDPANVKLTFASGPNDAWGDIPVIKVLGGAWLVNDNWVRSQEIIYRYPSGEGADVLRYLLPGRYDRCTLGTDHQVYE